MYSKSLLHIRQGHTVPSGTVTTAAARPAHPHRRTHQHRRRGSEHLPAGYCSEQPGACRSARARLHRLCYRLLGAGSPPRRPWHPVETDGERGQCPGVPLNRKDQQEPRQRVWQRGQGDHRSQTKVCRGSKTIKSRARVGCHVSPERCRLQPGADTHRFAGMELICPVESCSRTCGAGHRHPAETG